MKKIKLVFTMVILLALSAFALEVEQKEYEKVKKDGFFGIVDKSTNETVIPFEYKKIKKQEADIFKVKNKENKWKVLNAQNEIFLDGDFNKVKTSKINKNKVYKGIYNKDFKVIYLKSKDYNSEELLEKIYEKNNEISNVKFYGYPKSGTIIIKKNDKYGFLSAQKDCLVYLPPKYHNIYVPDSNTSVFKFLGISYSDIKNIKFYDGYYWFSFDEQGKEKQKKSYLKRLASSPYLEEKVEIKDNNLIFNYVSKSDELSNIALSAFPDKKEDYFGIGEIENNFKNYIEFKEDEIKIIEDKNIYSIPENNYEDFYFQDLNTIIYNIKNISYSNPNRIFAKKDGLWGIIDRDENIISDFQYEEIFGLEAKEIINLTENEKKYNLEYKEIIFPENKVFIVKKEGKYAVINENGEILIPYNNLVNKKLSEKIIKNYKKTSVSKIPYKTSSPLIAKPFSLNLPVVQPYVLSDISYSLAQKVLDKLF